MGQASEIIRKTDKGFWHGYIDFYEQVFGGRSFERIAEIGIFRGNSIRWLLERFPHSTVHGADIAPRVAEYPQDERFTFVQMDQGDSVQLRGFLSGGFDLIIEDGSHFPAHQVLGLVEGLAALRPGGIYILEDIQTSHPLYQRRWWERKRPGNALSVLLAIQHYKRIGAAIDAEKAQRIAAGSLMSAAQVTALADQISALALYRRSTLPDSCWSCGASDYAFSDYRCQCGESIFSDTDSMSFAVHKRL
jgi:hypothetical protein